MKSGRGGAHRTRRAGNGDQALRVLLRLTLLMTSTTGDGVHRTAAQTTTLAGTPGLQGYSDVLQTNSLFNWPSGIAVDSAGEVALIADTNNNIVRRMNISSRQVSTLAGMLSISGYRDGLFATFNSPYGIAMDSIGAVALVVSPLLAHTSEPASIIRPLTCLHPHPPTHRRTPTTT